MDWATFWATFSQTHLVTLVPAVKVRMYLLALNANFIFA
jgi:hypothetical protein